MRLPGQYVTWNIQATPLQSVTPYRAHRNQSTVSSVALSLQGFLPQFQHTLSISCFHFIPFISFGCTILLLSLKPCLLVNSYFIIENLHNRNHFSEHSPLGGLQSFPSVSSNIAFYKRDLATKRRNTMAKLNQQNLAKEQM